MSCRQNASLNHNNNSLRPGYETRHIPRTVEEATEASPLSELGIPNNDSLRADYKTRRIPITTEDTTETNSLSGLGIPIEGVTTETIEAELSEVSDQETNTRVPGMSYKISQSERESLRNRIRQWAILTNNALDNGSKECRALTVMQCKLTVLEYKEIALDWIELPVFEREIQRHDNPTLQINNKAKQWIFGEGIELGSEFLNILDNLMVEDQKVLPRIRKEIIDNEVYPSLSDIEKVDQWAADALEDFERRKQRRGFFDILQFNWPYSEAVEEAKLFLRDWVQKTADERDSRRFNAKVSNINIKEPLDSLYEEDETLRALWYLIEARDMLSKPQRDSEYGEAVAEEYQRWLVDMEKERLEAEKLEAEGQRGENEEKITHWESLSFEQREALRKSNEGITDQMNVAVLAVDLVEKIEAIEESDHQTRDELIRRQREERQKQWTMEREQQIQEAQRLREVQQQIDSWRELSFEQRENRRRSDQDITDQINLQELPNNLRGQLEDIENNDSLVRNRLARTELNRRKNMSYEERSGLRRFGRLFDVSRLSEELQSEIRQLRESDKEVRDNRRRAGQWAAAKAREERLQSAEQNIQDQSIVGYHRAKVKLWPIRCGRNASYKTVYPYTDDTKPIRVNLSSSDGLKLEIHRALLHKHQVYIPELCDRSLP